MSVEFLKIEKEGIIRDSKNLFEEGEEEYHYKPVRFGIFLVTLLSNMKVMVIEIKAYQSKNTLTKLNHT